MGFSGISIWQLLIVLLIVLVLFGTKRLRGIGSDLGSAVKGFRSAMKDGEKEEQEKPAPQKLEQSDTGAGSKTETGAGEKEKS